MSAAAAVLPFIWAVGDLQLETLQSPQTPVEPILLEPQPAEPQPVEHELAFYRKYTEAMMQRYLRMTMEAGKVSSLLGHEMFRGNVTNYKVDSFEDVVIYIHDVDRCLLKLDRQHRDLITRIAIQQYTLNETAVRLGLRHRTVVRRYGRALDALTKVFLDVKLLEPLKSCQGGRSPDFASSN
jgi:hypothetical protein